MAYVSYRLDLRVVVVVWLWAWLRLDQGMHVVCMGYKQICRRSALRLPPLGGLTHGVVVPVLARPIPKDRCRKL